MHGRMSGAQVVVATLCMALLLAAASLVVRGDTSNQAMAGRSVVHNSDDGSPSPLSPDPSTADARPNIVLVLTDDQSDLELDRMPKTRSLIADKGLQFTDAISPHPLCCPARAELVTGQYAQNNGVQHNRGPHGGYGALDPTNTIGTWFSDAGYQTAFIGKYLNEYGVDDPRQPGWDIWDPLVQGVYDYRNFTFYNNGLGLQRFENAYVTNEIERRTNEAVRTLAQRSEPFLLFSFHLAPHYRIADGQVENPPAEPRYAGDFSDAQSPSLSKPSFGTGAPAGRIAPSAHVDAAEVNEEYRARLRSLASVDDAVASLVNTLAETGELDNTWIFFTSDNGYSLGEHNFIGKNVLTDEALQVPLAVIGPQIANGSSSLPVTLVDLPATFADLAGVHPRLTTDGASLSTTLRGGVQEFRDTTLIQTGKAYGDGWEFRGVRTDRFVYGARSAGDRAFLYDHAVDPYELNNLVDDPQYDAIRAQLEARRQLLASCAGWACNPQFGALQGLPQAPSAARPGKH